MVYEDRRAAGQALADKLTQFKSEDVVILGLPRGGIEVAAAVARRLQAPLGLIMVRKIGHPVYPEYAIGAVAEDNLPVVNEDETSAMNEAWLERAVDEAIHLNAMRKQQYYGPDFMPPAVHDKVVILVDDGIATGLSMQAALQAVKPKHPAKVIVAVPVASEDVVAVLKRSADDVVVHDNPRTFAGSVGAHYRHFNQVTDEEVKTLLREVRDDIRQATPASS